jgi:hypothetical protein
MVSFRIALAGLLVLIPCTAQWTKEQREWALGTSALLTQMAGQRHEFLAGAEKPAEVGASEPQPNGRAGSYCTLTFTDGLADPPAVTTNG